MRDAISELLDLAADAPAMTLERMPPDFAEPVHSGVATAIKMRSPGLVDALNDSKGRQSGRLLKLRNALAEAKVNDRFAPQIRSFESLMPRPKTCRLRRIDECPLQASIPLASSIVGQCNSSWLESDFADPI